MCIQKPCCTQSLSYNCDRINNHKGGPTHKHGNKSWSLVKLCHQQKPFSGNSSIMVVLNLWCIALHHCEVFARTLDMWCQPLPKGTHCISSPRSRNFFILNFHKFVHWMTKSSPGLPIISLDVRTHTYACVNELNIQIKVKTCGIQYLQTGHVAIQFHAHKFRLTMILTVYWLCLCMTQNNSGLSALDSIFANNNASEDGGSIRVKVGAIS